MKFPGAVSLQGLSDHEEVEPIVMKIMKHVDFSQSGTHTAVFANIEYCCCLCLLQRVLVVYIIMVQCFSLDSQQLQGQINCLTLLHTFMG